ncbi:MAG TPA: redoxin domain-containing protein [Anaeromyxobacter sp.]|nr:redoxin domain-containing protein [Anaeromyxobacter sp.]
MKLRPGDAAPAAQVRDLGGRAVDLAALAAARPALLFFYKGDCPASGLAAHALPRLAAVPGVAVAAISQDGDAETRAFAARHALAAVSVLVDPAPYPASDAFGVLATPTWFLVAPGGRVDAMAEGWSRDDANALAARAAALAGRPAPVVSTAADGPAFRPG